MPSTESIDSAAGFASVIASVFSSDNHDIGSIIMTQEFFDFHVFGVTIGDHATNACKFREPHRATDLHVAPVSVRMRPLLPRCGVSAALPAVLSNQAVEQTGFGVTVHVLIFLLIGLEHRDLMVEPQLQLKLELLDDAHEGPKNLYMCRMGFGPSLHGTEGAPIAVAEALLNG